MIVAVADRVLSAYLQGLVDAAGAGQGPGRLHTYSAPMPAPGAPPGGATLLGTILLARPLGTVESRSLSFDPATPDLAADAGGMAAWARITDSDGLWVADFDISLEGEGGAIQMPDTQVIAGGTLTLASATLSV